MSMSAAERDRADAYAGPHHSFPEYTSGDHLRAAWDLAGHAKNPAAIRARVKAFAKAHGLTHLLPATAKALEPNEDDHDWDDANVDRVNDPNPMRPVLERLAARRGANQTEGHISINVATLDNGVDESRSGGTPKTGGSMTGDSTDNNDNVPAVRKASTDEDDISLPKVPRVRQMIHLAYETAEDSGDPYSKERVVRFAQENDLARHLPDRAHGFMHTRGIPHLHDGEDDPLHQHLVTKAVNVVIKLSTIQKAWGLDTGECVIEGWVSTDDVDAERDIVPPEAFKDAIGGYAERRMPLTSEHNMKGLPIGHGQHVALVRDGKVFSEAQHPTDAHDFEHFPGSGTGVYGRYLITDPTHAAAVKAGNIGGFSWVGNARSYEPRPGGGRKYVEINPWLESTVAAYPVNRKALVLAAKAYEAELAPEQDEGELTVTLEELLAGAAAAQKREDEAAQAVTKADLAQLVAALNTKIVEAVNEAVQKALPVDREGVGRKGGAPAEDPRDADPAAYIVKKAREVNGRDEELSDEDKQLAWGIFHAALVQGMAGGD